MWQSPIPPAAVCVIMYVIAPMPETLFHTAGIHGVKAGSMYVQGLAAVKAFAIGQSPDCGADRVRIPFANVA